MKSHQYIEQLWAGQVTQTPNYPIGRIYRAALIMISCDPPAARKILGGFSSHSSKRGCYKYDYTFPMIQDNSIGHWKPNFDNFSTIANLLYRLREKHQYIAYKFKKANSQLSDKDFKSQICYSDLSANIMIIFLDNENNIKY
ncbi:5334_t:CDS:2 [Funneliformis mosseae]|uniref:5334_t:CDS:1 n=1 Tax=Funneliformis mosseae TaxID=27381 RepID=A0A9N8ZG12_FUNMO|nr:5334_t:CDS:2 [Funneliformis mosseae]